MSNYYMENLRRGKEKEVEVKALLTARGWDIADSSQWDDMHRDIDCWAQLPGRTDTCGVSIKTPHSSGRAICLELGQVDRRGRVDPSWFFTSKAEWMVSALPDGKVYLLSFKEMREWYDTEGCYMETRRLSPDTQAKLASSTNSKGNPYHYIDSEFIYVNYSELMQVGACVLLQGANPPKRKLKQYGDGTYSAVSH